MNKKVIILVALIVGLIAILLIAKSCSPSTPKESSTKEVTPTHLSYDIDTLKKSTSDSTDKHLKMRIAHVTLADQGPIAKRINRAIEQMAYNQLFGDTLSSDGAFIAQLTEEYNSYSTDIPEGQEWEITQESSIVKNSDNFFTVLLTMYQFLGGAHGINSSLYLTFSTQTGQLLTLRELVKIEHVVELAQLAEKLFREQYEIAPDSSLQSAGFWFDNDRFSLAQTVGLTDEGLVFYYNSYEIAPYSLGPTKLVIPIEKCKGWLQQIN